MHSRGNMSVWENTAAIVQHEKIMSISIKEQQKREIFIVVSPSSELGVTHLWVNRINTYT